MTKGDYLSACHFFACIMCCRRRNTLLIDVLSIFFRWTPSVPTKNWRQGCSIYYVKEKIYFFRRKSSNADGEIYTGNPWSDPWKHRHTHVGGEMPMQRVSNTHPFPLSVWQEDHTEEKKTREKKRRGWKVQGIQNEPLLFPTHPAREEKENGMELKESSEEGKRSGGVTSFSWPEFFPLLAAGKGGPGEI